MGSAKHQLLLLILGIIAASCAPTTRFEWGDYETSLYQYYKSPTELDSYREALNEAIEVGRTDGRLAPGLCAELGYTYLEQGNIDAARELFEMEMANFPESRPFLGGLIERLSPQNTESGAPTS